MLQADLRQKIEYNEARIIELNSDIEKLQDQLRIAHPALAYQVKRDISTRRDEVFDLEKENYVLRQDLEKGKQINLFGDAD